MVIICLVIWSSSIAVVSPLIIYTDIVVIDDNKQECGLIFPDVANNSPTNQTDVLANVWIDDEKTCVQKELVIPHIIYMLIINLTTAICILNQRQSSAFFRNYLITAFIIGFVAPVSIISYCYTKIITTMNLVHRRAKQANAKISKSTSMASNSRLAARSTHNISHNSTQL